MTVVIHLSEFEVRCAAYGGIERRMMAMRKRRPQLHGSAGREREWQIDIVGCLSELAVARYRNLFWEPVTEHRLRDLPGDVGRVQVRSTQHPDGHLIVHPSDEDDAPFVLAVVHSAFSTSARLRVELKGWLPGRVAKQRGARRRGVTDVEFWVAQPRLRPMDQLEPYAQSLDLRTDNYAM